MHADAPMFVDGGDPFHLSDGCGDIDGMPASCTEISERLGNGTTWFEVDNGAFRPPQFAPLDIGLGGGQIPMSVWVPDGDQTVTRTYANGNILQITCVNNGGQWAPFGDGFGFTQRKPAATAEASQDR